MSSSTTPQHVVPTPAAATSAPLAPAPAEVRAERRRLVGSVRAARRLLEGRDAFERADLRRLAREARERSRAAAAHGRVSQRAAERRARKEESLHRRLGRLAPRRERQERQALEVLRRESVRRSLAGTRLAAGEVNGIGAGLVRALAERGISTAADFTRVSWGRAPGGKGGEVLYIHRASGGRVHINGIGEHRGRPLMAWRQAAVARAEAQAPRELPADERHRIAEIVEAERVRLQRELAELPRAAEAERREAARVHSEHLGRLDAAHRAAADRAAERRAEFDALAERLLALQTELGAHIARFGDVGRRTRRAESRALRPLPTVPSVRSAQPAPSAPLSAATATGESGATGATGEAGEAGERLVGGPAVDLTKPAHRPSPSPMAAPEASAALPATAPDAVPVAGVRAGLGWLVPIVFFGLTSVLGAGEPQEGGAPLWFAVGTRLTALALTADLLRLWLPRRRWRTAAPMPAGTGALCTGVLLALAAAGMFLDPHTHDNGAPWAVSVVAALSLLAGVARRSGRKG
ncbi:hypothetical protein [Streptomyces fragilis]|uniref:hypothetical protein n=1 Tax=Streptomyces fragilis TaxID=67301 RepID=UPI0024DE1D5C|nr:hypothetical protein [Streptomyces fragilis]